MRDDLFLGFYLDAQQYALPLACVQRVVRMVEILPLPHAPADILGVINVAGRVLPVVHLRRWLQHPPRESDPDDQLIIAAAAQAVLVLPVDTVTGVEHYPPAVRVRAAEILP